ncbi:protein of unknown function [Candidatus Nitrotoga arctica]|uniref:Cation/H+ exchanger domain-containing protein n=2 Tax=Candidatus Nitrotoga arctica TaxID=453162 RepID=A0ABN8AKM5_9PROT|nr:protein of unknown function [Candidatus Nitrotoga arctica]
MPFGLLAGESAFRMPLRDWINDGLLTIFFLVIGLEIKREFTVGRLATRRTAALPSGRGCRRHAAAPRLSTSRWRRPAPSRTNGPFRRRRTPRSRSPSSPCWATGCRSSCGSS